MQRYRRSSLLSLLFKIMNSDETWPCFCCSASLQSTRSRVPAPWNHSRNIPLEGLNDMREPSFTKHPFPNNKGGSNNDLLEPFLPWTSSGSICSTGTANWNSPAWTFPPWGFDLLLPIENSLSAIPAFKHITWQIMPLCILHAFCMNFILSAVIPHRVANSVPVRLFRIVQHLGALNHCQ